MSYILDALKKADSERARERSAVPGLDAQPEAALGGDMRRGNAPWRAVAIGSVLALMVVLAWWGLGREEPTTTMPPVAVTPPPIAETVAAAPAPSPAPSPAPAPASVPPVAMAAATTSPSPPVASPAVAAAIPPPLPPKRPRPITRAPVVGPAAAAAEPSVAAPPAKPSASAAADARLPTLAQLPAELRAALPPLAISGAVYAPQPSARMVFLNGQVLREGSEVAAGLTVERIGPTATVMSFRGTRFELRH